MNGHDKNPFIAIPATVGGISLVALALLLIFSPGNIRYIGTFVWGLVILGVFALFFALLAYNKYYANCGKLGPGKTVPSVKSVRKKRRR